MRYAVQNATSVESKTLIGKILNLKKTGEILGVSDRTVQNLIERGELPGFQVGNRWRVEESDIYAYIEAQKKKAKSQI